MQAMEGVRGFAVFLVFLVHYVTTLIPFLSREGATYTLATSLHTIGNVGVDLFFVLSGYLIYGSLIERPQPFIQFFKRRIARIYPAFITVFLIYAVLSIAMPARSKIPADLSEAAFYFALNFLLLPGLFPIEPLITVAWSLSYELFYYLLIPAIIAIFSMRHRSRQSRILFFAAIAVAILVYCGVFGGPIRLVMFVCGILLHELIQTRLVSAPGSRVAFIALLTGLFAMLLPVTAESGVAIKMAILFVSFFTVCLSCFLHPTGWLPRAFSWTPARWLGNMSYSYYLLHGLVLNAAFMGLNMLHPGTGHGFLFFALLLPPLFLLTLVPTAILFLLIERPFSLEPTRASGHDQRRKIQQGEY